MISSRKKRGEKEGSPSIEEYLAMSMKTHDQEERNLESLAMLLNKNNLLILSGDVYDKKVIRLDLQG